jgi:large conductance mechanosensitive channel
VVLTQMSGTAALRLPHRYLGAAVAAAASAQGGTMLKGFKEFLLRGNIVDLAIAVVIGTAFTALVAAFTATVINPLIARAGGGGVGDGLYIKLGDNPETWIRVGDFLTAIITFVITAAVVYFLVVIPMRRVMTRLDAQERGRRRSTSRLSCCATYETPRQPRSSDSAAGRDPDVSRLNRRGVGAPRGEAPRQRRHRRRRGHRRAKRRGPSLHRSPRRARQARPCP